MKVASVWAWLLVVIRFYFNEMPKISSGFQPSKCSSTLWRLNGCHRPTSTGTGLCISWCWENCDMLILTRFGLPHLYSCDEELKDQHHDIHLYIQSKMEAQGFLLAPLHQERQNRHLLLRIWRWWSTCQHCLGSCLDDAQGSHQMTRESSWVKQLKLTCLVGPVPSVMQEIVFDLENRKVGIAPAKCLHPNFAQKKSRPLHPDAIPSF